MPFTFDMLDSRTLEITASGRLEAGDYAQLLPRLEGLIEREGSIALLVHVADLEGWSPAGAWEDLKFDARHYRDVTRVALVTDDPRARWYLGLFRLFTAAEVEVFVDTDVEAARLWVRETSDGAAAGRTPGFRLLSPAFEPDGKIPDVHSRHGEDRSPALSWSGAPQGTRAYALIMHDPDAPGGHFTHWVAYNIPASDPNLPEGVAHRGDLIDGTLQGENDWGEFGYGGPRPPEGDEHRYVFRLYALDSPLSLGPGATEGTVKDAMRGHVLASTLLVGRHMQAA